LVAGSTKTVTLLGNSSHPRPISVTITSPLRGFPILNIYSQVPDPNPPVGAYDPGTLFVPNDGAAHPFRIKHSGAGTISDYTSCSASGSASIKFILYYPSLDQADITITVPPSSPLDTEKVTCIVSGQDNTLIQLNFQISVIAPPLCSLVTRIWQDAVLTFGNELYSFSLTYTAGYIDDGSDTGTNVFSGEEGYWTNGVSGALVFDRNSTLTTAGTVLGSRAGPPTGGDVPSQVRFPSDSGTDYFDPNVTGFGEYNQTGTHTWVSSDSSCTSYTGVRAVRGADLAFAPQISSVSPNVITNSQTGVVLTLTGAGLIDFTDFSGQVFWLPTVQIGGTDVPVSQVNKLSSTQIQLTVIVPSQLNGQQALTITNVGSGLNTTGYDRSLTSPPINITVGDSTPVVTSVTPQTVPAGASTDIVILGSGFGTNVPGVQMFAATPGDSGISVNVTDWSDGQINATATVPSPGIYAVQVTSGGTGLGFLSAAGSQATSAANKTVTAVANAPQLKITLADGTIVNNASSCAIITSVPAMPGLTAQLLASDGSSLAGTLNWQVKVHLSH